MISYTIGDCILIRFLAEEAESQHKLSKPWYGPYGIVALTETGETESLSLLHAAKLFLLSYMQDTLASPV